MLIKQVVSIIFGGGIVSVLNLLVYAAGIASLGPEKFSQVVILVAIFFGCIDIFNSGSSKALIDSYFLKYSSEIVLIDVIFSMLSFSLFAFLLYFLSELFGFKAEFGFYHYLMLLLMFVIYISTQFHLGYLRYSGRNHIVSIALSLIPLSRMCLILLFEYFSSFEWFLCLWVLVEVAPGLIFYLYYKHVADVTHDNLDDFKSFLRNYRGLLLANWSSNFIYSFSKHFDVVVFAALFSPALSSYYKLVKSIYNIAFNIGGSAVVFLFRYSFIRNGIFLSDIRLVGLSFIFIFIVSLSNLFIYSKMSPNVYFSMGFDYSFEGFLYFLSLIILIFVPTVFSRIIHYRIQLYNRSKFMMSACVDVFLLFLVMFLISSMSGSTAMFAALYVTPIFSFFSLLYFFLYSKISVQ